ncbi:hypothetical protein K435DRAFT_143595 [Dendrothele bispora CBS 962.96]|uniref:Uncharacterized protein n=1 Tax=Dendrothele bispora (strain CBS 962.96) TaxID=1314807 RepID=A0A4S8M001_DENBC|nr:hypothetical protein K435DRAFT_143595 [Dendrothele bispora CBS 962.96]
MTFIYIIAQSGFLCLATLLPISLLASSFRMIQLTDGMGLKVLIEEVANTAYGYCAL